MDDYLEKIIAHVDEQYSLVEKECAILRKLLKPWPKKRQTSHDSRPQEDSSKQKDANKMNAELTNLTLEEKGVIDEVDHLLNKAQKALRIKDKILTGSEEPSVADPESIQYSRDMKDNDAKANAKEISPNNIDNVKKKHDQEFINKSDIKHATEKNLVKKQETKSIKKNLSQLKSFPSSSSSAKTLRSSHTSSSHGLSRSTTPRPTSVSSHVRPSASSRNPRHTPAHMTAPFKTDVNATVPHRKANHIHKNLMNKPPHKKYSVVGAEQKQSSSIIGVKRFLRIPQNQSRKRETESVIAFGVKVKDEETRELDMNCNGHLEKVLISKLGEPVVHSDDERIKEVLISKLEKCSEEVESNMQKIFQDYVSEGLENRVDKQEKLFSLTDKSSKVKIPPTLSKLALENHALLEKCSTTKLVKKMPGVEAAKNFVERLNAQNQVSQELWTKAKALTCLQSHTLMLKSLQSLEVEKMSETTPYEEVCRAKRLLEFILSAFSDTQNDADCFSKIQFRQTPPSERISPQSVREEDGDDDALLSLFSHCGKILPARLVKDRGVKEALACSKLWTRLKFDKDIHQLHLHLLTLSKEEWWNVLCADLENSSIFQKVHALMTSSGVFFPAIVQNPYSCQ